VLAALFESGRAIDIVLAVLLAEAIVLLWRRRSTPVGIVLALAPAACMLLALRTVITGGGWPLVMGWLLLSWPLHLADLARRRW
jgi:hypothetical protein